MFPDCSDCHADGELLVEAFKKMQFRGRIDPDLARHAVAVLRGGQFWALADLLEASAEAWNELNWTEKNKCASNS